MNQLMAIQPNDLPQYWPQIRDEVHLVEAPDGFLPEDAYAMCRAGNATLFFLLTDGKRVGWMVCRMNAPDLHIWMLFAKAGYDVMSTFRDNLMELARGAQAKNLTYGSSRKGWQKVSATHGFTLRMVVYECKVEPPRPPAEEQAPTVESNGTGELPTPEGAGATVANEATI